MQCYVTLRYVKYCNGTSPAWETSRTEPRAEQILAEHFVSVLPGRALERGKRFFYFLGYGDNFEVIISKYVTATSAQNQLLFKIPFDKR